MSKKVSLLVFASGSGTHLQNFIDHQKSNAYQIQALICNNPKAYAIKRAKRSGIKTFLYNHQDYSTRQDFEQEILTSIKQLDFDLIILAGFMRILSPYFFSQIKVPILNIHPSLLPKYKGMNTHKQVLMSQDRYHGASVHLVNEQLDSGPIIKQMKIPIAPDDTEDSLMQKLLPLEHQLYIEVVSLFVKKKLILTPNEAYLLNEANLKEKITFPNIQFFDEP